MNTRADEHNRPVAFAMGDMGRHRDGRVVRQNADWKFDSLAGSGINRDVTNREGLAGWH
jgi:hypothetical protein